MQINSVMATPVRTATLGMTIADAAREMRDAGIGCLVVANSDRAQGMITDRDIAVRCAAEGHDASVCTVGEHMSSPAFAVSASTDVLEAARLITEHRMKRLVVQDAGRVTGLVSLSDVAKALDEPIHELMIGFGAVRRALPARRGGAAQPA